MKLKVLDLFSGIGGFSLGLERTGGFETVAFCEIEEYPQKVLRKHWPDVPIHPDVRKLTAEDLPDDIGLICGGYPCQPFSTAGKQRGQEDDRHLWPEFMRLISEIRPAWVIAENVAGHISMGLDSVLSDLESANYSWEAFVIPACAANAQHRRDRVWVVAYPNVQRLQERRQARWKEGGKERAAGVVNGAERLCDDVAHATSGIEPRRKHGSPAERGEATASKGAGFSGNQSVNPAANPHRRWREVGRDVSGDGRQWEPAAWNGISQPTSEPVMGRGTNGIPNRMDRLKALGNAVVPQIPELIGRAIMEYEKGSSCCVVD